MIYCVEPHEPFEDIYFQKSYLDQQNCSWTIIIDIDGVTLRYNNQLKFPHFYCRESNTVVKNTGMFFLEGDPFDIFYDIYNIIKYHKTKQIWLFLNKLFCLRLKQNTKLLISELDYLTSN